MNKPSDQPQKYTLIIIERLLDQNINTQRKSERKKRTLTESYYEIFDSPGIFESGTKKYIEYNENINFKDGYSPGELFFEFQKAGERDCFKNWLKKFKMPAYIKNQMKIEKGPDSWLYDMKLLVLAGMGKINITRIPPDIMHESICTIIPHCFEKGKMVSIQYVFENMYALLIFEILEALRHGRDFCECEVCGKFYVRKPQQTGLHCPDCKSESRQKGYTSKEIVALRTQKCRLKKLELTDNEYNKRLSEYKKKKGLL